MSVSIGSSIFKLKTMNTVARPSVSIFVLTYNAERYIVETLESLLAQDYSNYEIFVSDDASTDRTPEILENFRARYPDKMRLYLQPVNLGITNHCNFLLQKVTGDYVCFVGGDDLLEPNCLSRAVDCAMESGASIVFHLHQTVNSEGALLSRAGSFSTPHSGTLDDFVRKGVYTHANGMLVDARHLPPDGFDASMPYASDFDFILQVLRDGRRFYALPEYLSSYRKHDRSITATRAYECNMDTIKAYEKLYRVDGVNKKLLAVTISNLQRAVRKYDTADRYGYWLRTSLSTNPLNFKSLLALVVSTLTLGKLKL